MVGGNRRWLALDQHRLEGNRRRFGAVCGGKNRGRQRAAAGGVLLKRRCPTSSGRARLLQWKRTASIAPSRSRFLSPNWRRSKMTSPALRDRRTLIVEDEYLIATTLHDASESVGSVRPGAGPFSPESHGGDRFRPQDRPGDRGHQSRRRNGLSGGGRASGPEDPIHLYFWL
jgi:hypothetical protein